MGAASLIAIDWGSSSFRAFLLDGSGNVIDRISSNDGILQSNPKPFDQTLNKMCGPWQEQHGVIPVIMSGMIGSRNGWIETEYLSCPASIIDLKNALIPVPNHASTIHIVPGVRGENLFHEPDVMRGEEIQAFGALSVLDIKDALICLPGTHSKWCVIKNHQIHSLTTFMTGELFALTRTNSSIGPLVTGEAFDHSSFITGIKASRSDASLLNKLFSIRARTLLDEPQCTCMASYLSGIFIGTEIKAVVDTLENIETVILVGNDSLIHRYASALEMEKIHTVQVTGEHAFLHGIAQLTI
ncbi:2-dehydro-3-deoxygalactonokinase [Kordiimonas aquimaris]|uniref:2-dehydro-3-deoxygalactonokinase n=1 Tax=Kordiimonas aquimaris TaxID=707591 RepID=UPI0021D0960B|nr:2-dehydro-3-deoxygalactonokinase [Kordiimonas aquimaris]